MNATWIEGKFVKKDNIFYIEAACKLRTKLNDPEEILIWIKSTFLNVNILFLEMDTIIAKKNPNKKPTYWRICRWKQRLKPLSVWYAYECPMRYAKCSIITKLLQKFQRERCRSGNPAAKLGEVSWMSPVTINPSTVPLFSNDEVFYWWCLYTK